MTTLPTIARIGRAATLALMLAAPALSTAHAFDAFGSDNAFDVGAARHFQWA